MTYGPIAIKRRQVLGDLYGKCDKVEWIPVFMESSDGEALGHADESLGHYADAFLFHLPEEICKRLSTGHYNYSFNYDYTDPDASGPASQRRITLTNICLVGRKVPEASSKPVKKAKVEV
jgi:hypothetical protein